MNASTEPVLRLRRTPLFDFHVAHRAHLVPFAGWEMPLYYEGILPEHRAVRSAAGLFDVSHMGILTVAGGSAARLLSRRTTANLEKLLPGQCRYTFLTDFGGAIIDDLLITRIDPAQDPGATFLVVPNAATASLVYDLLRQHRRPDTTIIRHNEAVAILAVQGPDSRTRLESQFGWRLGGLKFYTARFFPATETAGVAAEGQLGPSWPADLERFVLVSRTGYTGELGYELFVPGGRAVEIAEALVQRGVVPCGLGARDTLRLEKGYLLSGQDFNRDRSPLEAGQERFVEFDHAFIGRDVLEKQRSEGTSVRMAGLEVEESGAIPRHGTPVASLGSPIGAVSSGGLSPTLGHGIALAYLPRALTDPGTNVVLELRGRGVPAKVVKLPFVPARPSNA